MSPKLADEARIVKAARIMNLLSDATLNALVNHEPEDADDEIAREAARRELLRRSLAVGVKG